MVHRGPSTGCQKCRDRHIKCDRAQPACSKCISRGHTCPGYTDVGGVVFKDLTQRVLNKQRRRARIAELAIARVPIRSQKLLSDPQSASICFFYQRYVLPASRYPSPTTGFLENVLPLYNSAAPLSALDLALPVLTARTLCLHHGQELMSPWHLQRERAAAQAIRTAILDPDETLRDETLLAVLCLGFAQFQAGRNVVGENACVHLNGALALVRHRGPDSFTSKLSQSLLVAVRSNVLLQSLWFSEDLASQGLVLLLPDVEPREFDPAISMQYLLARVLRLERQMLGNNLGITTEDRKGGLQSSIFREAQRLCEELVNWHRDVPLEWKVFALPQQPSASTYTPRTSGYAPAELAFVYGQWHCTYLLALRLAFAATSPGDVCDEMAELSARQVILGRAQQVVSSLLCSAIPFLDQYNTVKTPDLKGREGRTAELSGIGLPNRRYYLSNICYWALLTLTVKIDGADGFGVQPATLKRLSTWCQKAVGRYELIARSQKSSESKITSYLS